MVEEQANMKYQWLENKEIEIKAGEEGSIWESWMSEESGENWN